MTGQDLENLKHLDVPPARAEAKRAAIDAALAAFDAAAPTSAEFDDASQGNAASVRPMRTMNRKRSFPMNLASRQSLGLAASLAALVIAAPLAFRTFEAGRPDLGVAVAPPKLAEPKPVTTTLIPTEPRQEIDAATGKNADEKSAAASTAPNKPAPPIDARAKEDAKQDYAAGATSLAPMAAQPSLPAVPSPAPPPPASIAAFDGARADSNRPWRHLKTKRSPGAKGDVITITPYPSNAPDELGGLRGQSADKAAALTGELKESAAPSAAAPGFLAGDVADQPVAQPEYKDHDIFNAPDVNPVKQVASEPVSTFSVDVDTASYSFMRRALNAGHLPQKESVRVEELINYFPYAYPAPETAEVPFKPTVTVMPCPWKPTDKLVHVAIKGYDLKHAERPRANLVFLLDVSGSMESEDRLPLVKNALRLLLDQLQPDDTVGIVTYASGSGIALEPTKISDKQKILAAIDKLEAGGSTDGADGIADAYRLAEAGFDKKAVNRIVLATDGDFNVGITDRDQLTSYIERKRKSGVFLSILSVGEGNYNDALMQSLAQNGNGTASYVDTLNEARKVLVDEASSTLFTIAKDVKAQIEWNPARVAEYRLIGYETRALKREDFNNDQVDAGDIGSGHTVTAIYEVTPVGAPRLVDDLRYAKPATATTGGAAPSAQTPAPTSTSEPGEYGFLKLRYKKPDKDASELISLPITDTLAKPAIADAPQDVRFSVAVAAFGDLVRGAPFVNGYTYDDVIALAQTARGDDPFGYRAEFLNLVRLAKSARP
jgi:Ca-activated chloride channel family protein